jgi:hypothetical protein
MMRSEIETICAVCGVRLPQFFYALDWASVVPEHLRNKILCLACYRKLAREKGIELKEGENIWMIDRWDLRTGRAILTRKLDGWL